MTKRKWKHSGLRTSWWIVGLVGKASERMVNLHYYLMGAMFDRCAECNVEEGYGHRTECRYAQPPIIHKGRVVKVSKRPPLVLPEDG